jgi:hypothetical protein
VLPINILAGLKLNGRNPKVAPVKAAVIIDAKGPTVGVNIETRNNDKDEIVETPAARPSNPSIRLKAFVIPITQSIVSG